jgi:hypothetical protein
VAISISILVVALVVPQVLCITNDPTSVDCKLTLPIQIHLFYFVED